MQALIWDQKYIMITTIHMTKERQISIIKIKSISDDII